MSPPEPIPNLLTKLELNAHGCLSLAQLLEAFQTPITEEHAWALLFQSVQSTQRILNNEQTKKDCYLVTRSDELFICKDGTIHPDSFLMHISNEKSFRRKCFKERKLISNLGVVIFLALDFGIPCNAERSISMDLEKLLDLMVSEDLNYDSEDDCDDEAVECNFKSIIQTCVQRLIGSHRTRSREASAFLIAESHYKAVCRAYVAEALELSSFLQKVAKCKAGLQTLDSTTRKTASRFCIQLDSKGSTAELAKFDKLGFSDWARLWVQVIRELRQGVKFKRNITEEACTQPPIEYTLSPYEILMDDIRSKRYALKKVETCPAKEKDDAHDIILDFIRSRPPLRKTNERIRGSANARPQTELEQLMNSMRLRQTKTGVPKN